MGSSGEAGGVPRRFPGLVRRALGRQALQPLGDAPIAVPASPERTSLDDHKERVSAQMSAFFDAVDTQVGAWIGYGGNIRETLRERIVPAGPHRRRLNTEGIDPVLQAYVHHDIFHFRLDNERGDPEAMYTINCQRGGFSPSVYVATHDGSVEATPYMGPNLDRFHHVKIRRVFATGRVRELTTFTPNFRDSYGPPHPLLVGEGMLPTPNAHMIYDHINGAGDVVQLDGRTVGDRGDPASFPQQTNIYAELAAITRNIRSISSDG